MALKQKNTHYGANMAERVANMYNKSTNDATAYSNKLNADNTYRGNYANFLYNRTYRDWETDRKSTRLNSSHSAKSRMPSSA